MPPSSSGLCALVAMELLNVLSLSTVNRSTTRLGRPARVELTSNVSRSNLIPTLTTAVSRSRARVGGFMRLKKPFGICSGRVHEYYIRLNVYEVTGPKGSAVAAAAASAGARELCERRKRAGTFSGTLPSLRTRGGGEAAEPARGTGARGERAVQKEKNK